MELVYNFIMPEREFSYRPKTAAEILREISAPIYVDAAVTPERQYTNQAARNTLASPEVERPTIFVSSKFLPIIEVARKKASALKQKDFPPSKVDEFESSSNHITVLGEYHMHPDSFDALKKIIASLDGIPLNDLLFITEGISRASEETTEYAMQKIASQSGVDIENGVLTMSHLSVIKQATKLINAFILEHQLPHPLVIWMDVLGFVVRYKAAQATQTQVLPENRVEYEKLYPQYLEVYKTQLAKEHAVSAGLLSMVINNKECQKLLEQTVDQKFPHESAECFAMEMLARASDILTIDLLKQVLVKHKNKKRIVICAGMNHKAVIHEAVTQLSSPRDRPYPNSHPID